MLFLHGTYHFSTGDTFYLFYRLSSPELQGDSRGAGILFWTWLYLQCLEQCLEESGLHPRLRMSGELPWHLQLTLDSRGLQAHCCRLHQAPPSAPEWVYQCTRVATTNTRGWAAPATGTYSPQFWRLEGQAQGGSRVGISQGLLPGHLPLLPTASSQGCPSVCTYP